MYALVAFLPSCNIVQWKIINGVDRVSITSVACSTSHPQHNVPRIKDECSIIRGIISPTTKWQRAGHHCRQGWQSLYSPNEFIDWPACCYGNDPDIGNNTSFKGFVQNVKHGFEFIENQLTMLGWREIALRAFRKWKMFCFRSLNCAIHQVLRC